MTYVLFSLEPSSNIFLIGRRIQRQITIHVCGFHVMLFVFVHLNWIFSEQILGKSPRNFVTKIHPVRTTLFHEYGHTDKRTDGQTLQS